jgi:hypothetical protein
MLIAMEELVAHALRKQGTSDWTITGLNREWAAAKSRTAKATMAVLVSEWALQFVWIWGDDRRMLFKTRSLLLDAMLSHRLWQYAADEDEGAPNPCPRIRELLEAVNLLSRPRLNVGEQDKVRVMLRVPSTHAGKFNTFIEDITERKLELV